MFGLVSGRRIQRRYSLPETTLQHGNFRGMVHKDIGIKFKYSWLSQKKKFENLVSINLGFRFNEIITLREYTNYCTNYRITTLY